MALIQNVLILAVLCVLAGALTQASEEGQQNDGDWSPDTQQKLREHNHDNKHDHDHDHDHEHEHDSEPTWVSCDFTIIPNRRCHDCYTRLICKRIGGLLLDCPSSYAPYCNNGLCSPVPSMGCA